MFEVVYKVKPFETPCQIKSYVDSLLMKNKKPLPEVLSDSGLVLMLPKIARKYTGCKPINGYIL